MHLIAERGTITRVALVAEVTTRYGAEAKFHTCSAEGMGLDMLLGFLLGRGKIQEGPLGLSMDGSGQVCKKNRFL